MSNSNRPVYEVQLCNLKAVVTAYESHNCVRHSIEFFRLYRVDNQRESNHSFSRDDLLLLAKLADQVHTWICEQ